MGILDAQKKSKYSCHVLCSNWLVLMSSSFVVQANQILPPVLCQRGEEKGPRLIFHHLPLLNTFKGSWLFLCSSVGTSLLRLQLCYTSRLSLSGPILQVGLTLKVKMIIPTFLHNLVCLGPYLSTLSQRVPYAMIQGELIDVSLSGWHHPTPFILKLRLFLHNYTVRATLLGQVVRFAPPAPIEMIHVVALSTMSTKSFVQKLFQPFLLGLELVPTFSRRQRFIPSPFSSAIMDLRSPKFHWLYLLIQEAIFNLRHILGNIFSRSCHLCGFHLLLI